MKAAVELAALVADLPDDAARNLWATATAGPTRVAGNVASRPPGVAGYAASVPAAVVAWAISSYASDGTTNARNLATRDRRPEPIDVQLPSRSSTTSPAVGRS
jgi:hypothetical protein